MNKIVALLSVVLLSSGCAVGPNYKKPAASVPDTYRGLTPEEAAKTQSVSIGDQKWWEVFQDEQLRSLIRTALQQNYDVRIAASRIMAPASAREPQLPTHDRQNRPSFLLLKEALVRWIYPLPGSSISGENTGARPRLREPTSSPAKGLAGRSL